MPKAIAFTTQEGGQWKPLPPSISIPSINFDWSEHPNDYFALLFDDGTIRDRKTESLLSKADLEILLKWLKEDSHAS